MGAWIETNDNLLIGAQVKSHPTWVRGLKLSIIFAAHNKKQSHPTWVRGLKPIAAAQNKKIAMSHPTWVRGLKQVKKSNAKRHRHVAPYVGAWIETSSKRELAAGIPSRTLRGCVD